MKPLQSIAMGLVIIVLTAKFDGYDALADPVGWALVLLGVRRLSLGSSTTGLGVLALVVSAVVWLPGTQEWLAENDPSLRWAVNLAQVGFCIWLCNDLGRLAGDAGDVRARAWWRTLLVLNVVLAVAPVLVFAADAESVINGVYAGAAAVLLVLIVLLFAHSGRPWANPAPAPAGR